MLMGEQLRWSQFISGLPEEFILEESTASLMGFAENASEKNG